MAFKLSVCQSPSLASRPLQVDFSTLYTEDGYNRSVMFRAKTTKFFYLAWYNYGVVFLKGYVFVFTAQWYTVKLPVKEADNIAIFIPRFYVVIRDFKQIATAGANTAAGSKFPPKWDTAHVRRLHPAVAWNLTTFVAMFCRSCLLRRVYFASLALFNGHLGILRIPLDTISFKVNLSQRLCQGCLS